MSLWNRLRTQGLLLPLGLAVALGGDWLQERHGGAHAVTTAPLSRPAASVQEGSAAPGWEVGVHQVYALTATRDRVTLRSSWHSTVVRADALLVQLEVRLESPELVDSSGPDAAERGQLQAQLAQPFLINLDPEGGLRSLRMRKDVGPQARGWLKSLAALVQYVRPGAAARTWSAEEADAIGNYVASYKLSADKTRCDKVLTRYTHVAAAQGLLPVRSLERVHTTLALQYTLDAAAGEAERVRAVQGRATLEVEPGTGMPAGAATAISELSWIRQRSKRDIIVSQRALVGSGPDYELVPLATLDAVANAKKDDAPKNLLHTSYLRRPEHDRRPPFHL